MSSEYYDVKEQGLLYGEMARDGSIIKNICLDGKRLCHLQTTGKLPTSINHAFNDFLSRQGTGDSTLPDLQQSAMPCHGAQQRDRTRGNAIPVESDMVCTTLCLGVRPAIYAQQRLTFLLLLPLSSLSLCWCLGCGDGTNRYHVSRSSTSGMYLPSSGGAILCFTGPAILRHHCPYRPQYRCIFQPVLCRGIYDC